MHKCVRACVHACVCVCAVECGCQSWILNGGKWKPVDEELARHSHVGKSSWAHLRILAGMSFIGGAMQGFSALVEAWKSRATSRKL